MEYNSVRWQDYHDLQNDIAKLINENYKDLDDELIASVLGCLYSDYLYKTCPHYSIESSNLIKKIYNHLYETWEKHSIKELEERIIVKVKCPRGKAGDVWTSPKGMYSLEKVEPEGEYFIETWVR